MLTMKVLLGLAVQTRWKESSSERKEIERITFAEVQGADSWEEVRRQDIISQRVSGALKCKKQRRDWADDILEFTPMFGDED